MKDVSNVFSKRVLTTHGSVPRHESDRLHFPNTVEEAGGVYMAVYPDFIFFLAAIQVCCAALAMVTIRAIATLVRTNIQGLARMSEGEAAIY